MKIKCNQCGKRFMAGGRGKPKKSAKYCSHHCHMLDRYDEYESTLRNKDWLIQKYITEKLSLAEIGRMLECPTTSVKRCMEGFGIHIRGIAESRIILFDKRGRKEVSQQELIEGYGGMCDCCGEKESAFLTLDHIGGGGGKHREKLKSEGKCGTREIRRQLKAAGWPREFQGYRFRLFCMNCNHATRHGNTCPHELKHQSKKRTV